MIAGVALRQEANRKRPGRSTVSISLAEDVKTVEDLEAAPRALLEQAQRTGRPIVIAEAGKPAVVMLTAERYEWLIHLLNLSRLLHEGEESIRKEGTIPLDDFIRDMEAKHGYKLSRRARPARKS
jgi:prevent-host-death family protein